LVLDVQPGGAIVPANKMFDAIDAGVLDVAFETGSYWLDKFPAASLFTYMVGGLSPTEQLVWYIKGGGVELQRKMVEKYNVYILKSPYMVHPSEVFLWSTKLLTKATDIKGLKIRTSGDDAAVFVKMGGSVVNLAVGEIYESVKRGVIDSFQLNTPATDLVSAMHEIAQYMYMSPLRQPCGLANVIINKGTWAKLPPDLQSLLEAVIQAGQITGYANWTALDLEAIKKFKDYGTKITPLPKEIEDEFARLALVYYDELAAKDSFAAQAISSLRAFKKAYREAWPSGL
jgi:TRAP-type mannitol/chloroaromatic compound transport system substrate-binding protein